MYLFSLSCKKKRQRNFLTFSFNGTQGEGVKFFGRKKRKERSMNLMFNTHLTSEDAIQQRERVTVTQLNHLLCVTCCNHKLRLHSLKVLVETKLPVYELHVLPTMCCYCKVKREISESIKCTVNENILECRTVCLKPISNENIIKT